MGDYGKYFLCFCLAAAAKIMLLPASVHAQGPKATKATVQVLKPPTSVQARGAKRNLLTDKDVAEIVEVFEKADRMKIGADRKISVIDCIQIVCHKVGLSPESFLVIGLKETRLSPDARENDGAKGMLQLKDERFIEQVANYGHDVRDILKELAPKAARKLEQVLTKIPYVSDPQYPDKKIFASSRLKPHVRQEILSLRRCGTAHDNVIVEVVFVAKDLRVRRDLVRQEIKRPIPAGGAVLHSLHRFGASGITLHALEKRRNQVERADRRYAEISGVFRSLLEAKDEREEEGAKVREKPFPPEASVTPKGSALTLH